MGKHTWLEEILQRVSTYRLGDTQNPIGPDEAKRKILAHYRLKDEIPTMVRRAELEERIYALEQASRAYNHERDPQEWADQEIAKAEKELNKLIKIRGE